MQMKDKIVINDYIENDPLSDENLDGVLDLVTEINKRYNIPQDIVCNNNSDRNILNRNTDEIRLLLPNKSIWIYSGYTWNQVMYPVITDDFNPSRDELLHKRKEIVKQCTIMVDGRYIDSQRNPSKKFAGSDNQRVISIQESIKQGKVVLYCD